jgi:hypothetical protein
MSENAVADVMEFPCFCKKGTIVATRPSGRYTEEMNCRKCLYIISDKSPEWYGDDDEDYRFGVPDKAPSDPFLAMLLGREPASEDVADQEWPALPTPGPWDAQEWPVVVLAAPDMDGNKPSGGSLEDAKRRYDQAMAVWARK